MQESFCQRATIASGTLAGIACPHCALHPGAGPVSRYSVLDKVVPGYYHRLEEDGSICGSAFGNNNAGASG